MHRTDTTPPIDPARIAYCSVATPSHFPAAVATLQSIRSFHPEGRFLLLLVEGRAPGTLPSGIEGIDAESIVDPRVLGGMRRRYTRTELCFAVKPFLLRAVLHAGASQAHYFDGDCLAFAPLHELSDQLDHADLLLTPHSFTPIPDDGQTPRPLTLLRAGTFNAGYLGVRATESGHRALDWLARMTEDRAFNRPRDGMCGDQRWLDLVPVLYPGAAICRHPGANVAYWNLHERPLTRDGSGQPCAAGRPLLFFHFSGHDPAYPDSLSVHQTRHGIAEGSVLADLLARYRANLPKPPRARIGLRIRRGVALR